MRLVITEAARSCGLEPEIIERFITFSWVRPASEDPLELDERDLARCLLIWQLQEEFGVNDQAVPVILELIDHVHRLQREIRSSKP